MTSTIASSITATTAATQVVTAAGVDFVEWGIPDHGALQRLTGIQSPTLILQGDADLMIPPKVSHLMAGLIPNAEVRTFPDAAHGFLFQDPADVARDVNAFLARDHGVDRS